MSIRLAGMVSGMDTDSMVQELVKAYSTKKDNLKKAQTKLSWKQDSWKEMNTKIYSFYSKSLSNMRFSSSYRKKKTAVSDETKASVVAGDSAVVGAQTLAVKKLATAGYLTGGKIATQAGGVPTADTTLGDMGVTGESSFTVTNKGQEYTVTMNESTTLSGLASQIAATGLGASYDVANQRFFVNATGTGVEKDFTMTANDANAAANMDKLGLIAASDFSSGGAYSLLADYADHYTDPTHPTTIKVRALIDAEVAKRTANYEEILKEAQKNVVDADKQISDMNLYLNGDGTEENKGAVAEADVNDAYKSAIEKLTTLSAAELEEKYGVTDKDSVDESVRRKNISAILAKDNETVQNDSTATAEDKEKMKIASTLASNISNSYTNIKSAEDAKTTALDTIDKIDGTAENPDGGKLDTVQADVEADYLARAQAAKEMITNPPVTGSTTGSAVRIIGQDSEIYLNNASFTSDSNTFTINGLTITAKAETGMKETAVDPDDPTSYNTISLTTDYDVDAIYDGIKSWIKEYNTLVTAMDKSFNAESSKGYEPLTDEEKEAMTEDEVKKWEQKIKDSLLRRDDTLDSVTNAMKNAMAETFTVNGKTVSLSTYGISTMSYFLSADNEKGCFHIDGDKDDSVTSLESDKLRTAIAKDPEAVGEFFQKLTTNLYNELSKKMSSTTLSSAYTVYNDKEMKSEYSEYTKKVSEQEKKLAKIEDKYYKQFSAMEKAMANLNSSQSALSGLLGGN